MRREAFLTSSFSSSIKAISNLSEEDIVIKLEAIAVDILRGMKGNSYSYCSLKNSLLHVGERIIHLPLVPMSSSALPSENCDSTTIDLSTKPSTLSAHKGLSNVLHHKDDDRRINLAHDIFRREILEGFISSPPEETAKGNCKDLTVIKGHGARYAGQVGFRCRFCKHLREDQRAKLSSIHPQMLNGLYRANIRFRSKHFPHCKFIPQEIRERIAKLKKCKDGFRGSKNYWVESAIKNGLRNSPNGIIYCPDGKAMPDFIK